MQKYPVEIFMKAYNDCFDWIFPRRGNELVGFKDKFSKELEILETQSGLKQSLREMYAWRLKAEHEI